MNWVRVRLALEQLAADDALEVVLDDGEPLESVGASAREDGHRVLVDGGLMTIVKGER